MTESATTTPALQPVENSTSIAAIGYEPDALALFIQFKGGAVYQYAGVSQEIFDQLRSAESLGKFYMSHVRGKFEGQALIAPKA